jgi:polar amino acid transport system substrate-binding protein
MLSRRRLLTATGVGILAAGCARDRRPTLQRIRDSHSIRVGISGEQPYSFLDSSGMITGQSPEVARAVLRGLGVSVLEAVQRPFAQLIDSLLAGSFDIMAAGMTITPSRCGRVAFSRPDFLSPTAFLVQRGNPLRLGSFADVERAGVPIAVLNGSVEQAAARDTGIRADRIKVYGTQTLLFDGVLQGDAPVGALTDISLRNILRREPKSGLEVTSAVTLDIEGRPTQPAAGFAFRPADADLCQVFSTALAALQRSGEWLRIAEPFGASASNLPPDDLTTAQLCRPT